MYNFVSAKSLHTNLIKLYPTSDLRINTCFFDKFTDGLIEQWVSTASKAVFSISQIQIENLKSVCKGTADMSGHGSPVTSWQSRFNAIYGQNGSGKTTVLDAIAILKNYMSDMSLAISDNPAWLRTGADELHLKYTLCYNELSWDDIYYEIIIDITFKLTEQKLILSQEKLSAKRHTQETVSDEIMLISRSGNKLDVYADWNNEIPADEFEVSALSNILKKSTEDNKSFIFSKAFIADICSKGIKELAFVPKLRVYALEYMYIVDPFYDDTDELYRGIFEKELWIKPYWKDYFTNPAPEIILNKDAEALLKGIKAVNAMLPAVIGDGRIGIFYYSDADTGLPILYEGEKVDVSTAELKPLTDEIVRKRHPADSLMIKLTINRHGCVYELAQESKGVQRLIMLLLPLVYAFNNSMVLTVIDEIDAGLHSSVLKSIIQAYTRYGKGQLICTCHNLEPLEILHNESVIFTTENPKNRYIHLEESNQGLRADYLRAINLGSESERLLCDMDAEYLAKAMMLTDGII